MFQWRAGDVERERCLETLLPALEAEGSSSIVSDTGVDTEASDTSRRVRRMYRAHET